MRVLLVEDEEHKVTDLTRRIEASGVERKDLVVCSGVGEAVIRATSENFDLIVLDMALPTYPKGVVGGGSQSVGGVEILRGLKEAGIRRRIVICTQYPGIVVGGKNVRLPQVARIVSQRYDQDVLGAVLYRFKNSEWEKEFDELLRRIT
jgi:CheY-like chemotaxis protein